MKKSRNKPNKVSPADGTKVPVASSDAEYDEARRIVVRLRVISIEEDVPEEKREPLFQQAFKLLAKRAALVAVYEIIREIIRIHRE